MLEHAARLTAGPAQASAWRDEVRGVRVVWQRELVRFFRDRLRILTSLAQPVLFLFILGTGLSPVVQTSSQGFDFRTFLFPGVIAMSVLFTSIFSAISIVWDREFGFLREMLVAPVSRGSVVVGKCLGGATVATFQGAIILTLAGLVDVPYSPVLLLTLVAEMAITAFTLTAFGIVLAARMQQVQSFQVVVQFVVLPVFFLSGAVFPLTALPGWLLVLTRIDPLSYAVDAMRRAVFAHEAAPAGAAQTLGQGMTLGGWLVPVGVEVGFVALLGLAFLYIAVAEFSRVE